MRLLPRHSKRGYPSPGVPTQKIGKTFDRAVEEVDPAWNDDIYDWNPIFPFYIPKTLDR